MSKPISTTEAAIWAAPALAALIWAIGPDLLALPGRWSSDPKYSHVALVLIFAGWLLWARRGELAGPTGRPEPWGALLGLLAAGTIALGAFWGLEWARTIALLPALAGLGVALRGRHWLRWAGPSIGFLGFVVPLPPSAEEWLAGPLRTIASVLSAGALQAIGLPAVREGHVLRLDGYDVGVAEACSGLSMLMTFLAVAAAVAVVGCRRWPDRVAVLVAAPFIAVFANVFRVVATALAREWWGERAARAVFHDLAGWVMMPIALILMWLTLRFMGHWLEGGPSPPSPALAPARS